MFCFERAIALISRDRSVRLLAHELGVHAEDYSGTQTETPKYHLRSVNIPKECISVSNANASFAYDPEKHAGIEENEGIVCYSDWKPDSANCGWKESFAAIRKGSVFQIIPSRISASEIRPFSLNGNGPNWEQYIALAQLLDPSIELVFLEGGSGSGKTLLAIASAMEQIQQKDRYTQIIVTRPMVHLEDEDNMGYLPGDMEEKLSPWMRPIQQALGTIFNTDGKNPGVIEYYYNAGLIEFFSLDYIRGLTFIKKILIVDETQNLTLHQVKTIITRAGKGTKVVFTGDLGQIDRQKRLDKNSSGLAHAINRMRNRPRVGITIFKETVRSDLAKLAEEPL